MTGGGKEGPPRPASEQGRTALEVLDDIDRRQRYSGIWIALALRATGGRLTTFEIDADRAAAARENFRRAGLQDIGGLVVAENMQVPQPDPRYVQAVTTDPKLETVFLNMHATGLGVTLKKRS